MKQEIRDRLRKLHADLTARRNMYISGSDYRYFEQYVSGYFTALGDVYGVNLHHLFHEWMCARLQRRFSITALEFVYSEIAEKDGAQAEKLALDYLEAFCNDRDPVEKRAAP